MTQPDWLTQPLPDAEQIGQAATIAQRQAAEPESSVWVGASAGTGKTKVLTDRILRLLLNGSKPNRILALTFTKAAAAEMINRVMRRLSSWATIDDQALIDALDELLAKTPNQETQQRARQLFALVLETPGGMRIQTIHAFAQSLLSRFPLEAGVPSNFRVLDEREAQSILYDARDIVLARGMAENPQTRRHLSILSSYVDEDHFLQLINTLLSKRSQLENQWRLSGGVEGWNAQLLELLKTPDGMTSLDGFDDWARPKYAHHLAPMKELADTIAEYGSANPKKWEAVFRVFEKAPNAAGFIACSFNKEETKLRAIKTQTVTKAIAEKLPQATEILEAAQETAAELFAARNSIMLYEANVALMALAERMLEAYRQQKALRVRLDYDDLILKAEHLLTYAAGAAEWVLFKLDEGLTHILVDEAQDTSPVQWRVISALAQEFFAGKGQVEDEVRTLFVVGDRKQSIYSFQGADPNIFDAMRGDFAMRVQAAEQTWKQVPLNTSFRSTQAVLDLTDAVFNHDDVRQAVIGQTEDWQRHLAHRQQDPGSVTLWPFDADLKENEARDALVQRTADAIHGWVSGSDSEDENAWLTRSDGKGGWMKRRVTEGDILILLRKREPLAPMLIRALSERGVAIAGLDRMKLLDQLVIKDLIALGDFACYADDDLTCAAVLKGPFVNLAEDDLMTLAMMRKRGQSVWSALRDRAGSGDAQSPFAKAYKALEPFWQAAGFEPAVSFYAGLVAGSDGLKQAIARGGRTVQDPFEEFLSLAIDYENEGPATLQSFLSWVRQTSIEIKRDADSGKGHAPGVRIMTVHGAKGLEAPIVVLPCLETRAGKGDGFLWGMAKGNQSPSAIYQPRKAMGQKFGDYAVGDGLLDAWRENNDEERFAEECRLLYVALTRAADRLFVATDRIKKKDDGRPGWYSLVARGFETLGATANAFGDKCHITGAGNLKAEIEETALPVETTDTLPPRFLRPPTDEPNPPTPLTPSRQFDEDDDEVFISRQSDNAVALARGNAIHDILDSLPGLATSDHEVAIAKILARYADRLSSDEQSIIKKEVFEILNNPDFAPLFSERSRSEAPIVGMVGDHVVSGRVDRLVETDQAILIVDYKSNRPPPLHREDVSARYLKQMAAYKAVLGQVYQSKEIRCFLLWTSKTQLMDVTSLLPKL